jgi:Bacterial Ig-like domain (group 3)/FG-GAP-like repeat
MLLGKFNGSLSFLMWYSGTSTELTTVNSNGSLIASTTVPGMFNPTSVNRFASHDDVAGTYTDSDGNTGVAIFFGNGDGTFNSTPLIIADPPGYTSTNVKVADFNGDNKLGIVSAMASSTKPDELEVLLNSSNPKTPTVSVASSLNPSTDGETVTFTATVEPNPLNWPTESVIFYSGTTELAKVQLVNGTASVSTAKLEPGTHTITAAYSGDCCDYLPGSASMSQVVNK